MTDQKHAQISGDPSDAKKPTSRKQHKFFVVEVSEVADRRYPRTLFGCETIEEALRLCKEMNADAGFHKFAVRGESQEKK